MIIVMSDSQYANKLILITSLPLVFSHDYIVTLDHLENLAVVRCLIRPKGGSNATKMFLMFMYCT